ncbi:hypothetical protein SK128_021571 [Halocaridina rubra]|uniref:xanthine dehydrogenase n=1 Tax=Halocaridina rubra TaxID=373956 RepID=A0AAN8WNH5_HALRR
MADTEDTCKILVFFVNGKKIQDPDIDPEITLLYYLRNKLKLCGTKLGCGEGGCGACTVMISKYHPQEENIRHYSVNSCLTPVASVHGLAVTTVEGIRSTRNKLHVVQERIAKAHGSQCGFCTPGMVMSMYTLLRNNPIPSMAQLEEYLTGNLCRCTGYRPILDGFRGLTSDGMVIEGCGRADCCKFLRDKPGVINVPNCPVNGINEDNNVLEENDISHILYENDFKPYDPSQEVIFPPELKVHPELQTQNLEYRGPRLIFYRPSTLQQLLKLKAQHPEARLIVGNTEVGVEVKYKNKLYPVLINPSNIHDLTAVKRLDSGLQIGASVTLSKIGQILREEIKERKEHQTRIFTAILEMLKWFAGKQIRNVAAIGGNIMTGSPISDLNPLLMAARATLTFCSKERGERKLLMDENFFTGYRKTIALNDEILLYVHIPYTSMDEYMYSYKQSRRRGDDVAIVNAGMKVIFRKENDAVQDIVLAFGGMGPTIVMATNTMKELTGMSWNSSLLERGLSLLLEDLPLSPSAPGGMTEYRRALALSFFFKYYLNVLRQLSLRMPDKVSPLAEEELRAIEEPEHMLPRSTQLFQKVPPSQSTVDPIGRPMIHTSALKQATGEAVYIDDMPHYENELYASFVYSSHAHAKIISIDESEALNVDGVVRFFCARDLAREKNRVSKDNVVFVQDVVTCVGQIIGMIVAKNQPTAQRAAKLVKIQYEDIKPLIITIQDAIREKSYFNKWTLYKGNTESALNTSAHVLEGEMHVGGQEHFYLETQAQLVVPSCEDGTMEIFSSTQNPTDMQEKVAHVLGVLKNRVICRVKRLGGGFGGKETKPPFVAMPLCIAAAELNCPVRIMLDRHEDMVLTGGRHPFLCKWKVGFSDQGILLAIDADLYANAGYSLDISHAVVQNAMFAMDNAYKCDNVKIIGYVCKTNLPSNTAFRGFGTPQSTIFAEDIISRIAAFLNANANVIRERNMYRTGDTTHSKEILERCTVRRCWDEVLDQASFHIRKTRVDTFNK